MPGSRLDLLSPPRSLSEVTIFCLKPQEQAQFQGRVTWARIILCFFTLSSFLPCCPCSDIIYLSQQVAVCPCPGHQEHQPYAHCVALARGPLAGTILQQFVGVSWSTERLCGPGSAQVPTDPSSLASRAGIICVTVVVSPLIVSLGMSPRDWLCGLSF